VNHSNAQRNEKLFKALIGRTIADFSVELSPAKLYIRMDDGVIFSMWVDEECCICIDVDREQTH
jgi:hypothetical protein